MLDSEHLKRIVFEGDKILVIGDHENVSRRVVKPFSDLMRRQEELRRMEELHNQEMQKRKEIQLR